MEDASVLSALTELVSQNPWSSLLSSVIVTALVGTGIFSFLRRVKPGSEEIGQFFTDSKLLAPPMARPAYSDRMAYVLAEMSDLAYYQFEGAGGFINDAVEQALKARLDSAESIRDFLEQFRDQLMVSRNMGTDFLRQLLDKSGFELIDTINVGETQGFACRRKVANEPPYLVIAFRGTEKKVGDWLTDARAIPTVVGDTKVHSGFLEAFSVVTDSRGDTVKDRVRAIIHGDGAKDENGQPLPLFITGHSLGGALALLATRGLAPNINGACYTYGAPRLANYAYFARVKTPVYRLVNSSDIVPRVPPGAINALLLGLTRLLAWATGFAPAISSLFDKLEALLDKLNGYRHYGDLRYLTDVADGQFKTVELLRNPPAIDRAIWFWRHLAASLRLPLNSHRMSLYRQKLQQVASERNRRVDD